MNIIGYQVNVTKDIAIGVVFTSYEGALKWVDDHPREGGYHSVETIFEK